jgi:hypothetical protein
MPEKYNISIIYNRNMPVYAILIQSEDGVELLPNYFSTYQNALDKVKKLYRDVWDDRFEEDGTVNIYSNNKVEVGEGHKANGRIEEDFNLTELYIERGIHISIRRLVKKPTRASAAAAGGGYSRRRQRKINTKNSRKHGI